MFNLSALEYTSLGLTVATAILLCLLAHSIVHNSSYGLVACLSLILSIGTGILNFHIDWTFAGFVIFTGFFVALFGPMAYNNRKGGPAAAQRLRASL